MRIVSLLPSATETLFALGLGDQLVAVTHECDYPPDASSLPVVTRSTLELAGRSSSDIEDAVNLAARDGRSLYRVDTEAILRFEPDLVIAQDICDVCAIPADQVAADLAGIRMIRQHPHSLADVLSDIEALAGVCGADPRPLMSNLRGRIAAASHAVARLPRVRGVFLEWIDPPYPAGHWTPDILSAAGVDDPLARPGRPSKAVSWDDVSAARPSLLILAPCGFNQARAETEAESARRQVASSGAGTVLVLDGSAYFNRPGPRLVDSLELLVAKRAPQLEVDTSGRGDA